MRPPAIALLFQQAVEPGLSALLKPSNLGHIATLLPQRLNRLFVQTMINRVFAEQINEGEFEFLEGRKLQIEVIDAAEFVGVSFVGKRIICNHFYHKPRQAEATLSLQLADAISLIEQQVDPDTLFFQRRLKINGDTELHIRSRIRLIPWTRSLSRLR